MKKIADGRKSEQRAEKRSKERVVNERRILAKKFCSRLPPLSFHPKGSLSEEKTDNCILTFPFVRSSTSTHRDPNSCVDLVVSSA